jgi:hypothetical protein
LIAKISRIEERRTRLGARQLAVHELSKMMRDRDVEVTPLLIQDERYNDLF